MAAISAKNEKGNGPVFRACLESETELGSLQEENRSLKIKIAGVDTLSSLLRGTRDELETICVEKENLEIEVSRLQCRCSMLEKDLATAKIASQSTTGHAKDMFEALLKENKKLKDELKYVKNHGNCKESIFGPEAMCELLAFKGELENEITNLQKAMSSHEEESSISQISRLLGQVTKLEYHLKTKEEECQDLRNKLDSLKAPSENDAHITSEENYPQKESGELTLESKIDIGVQANVKVDDAATQTEATEDIQLKAQEVNMDDSQSITNEAPEVVLRKNTSSIKRRSSKLASGDWSQIRKVYSDVFEDEWNLDVINTNEQLKITQDLLIQANEIIMTMTEENEKLLKVNGKLLLDIAQGEKIQLSDKEKILNRFKFLFTEINLENHTKNMEEIQDILITGDFNAVDGRDRSDFEDTSLDITKSEDCCLSNNLESQQNVTPIIETSHGMEKDTNYKGCYGEATGNGNGKDKADDKKMTQQTRDSGVDIYTTEHEKQTLLLSPANTHPISLDDKKSSDGDSLLVENAKLTSEVEIHMNKLAEADKKISHLEQLLTSLKESERQRKETLLQKEADIPTGRLSKSIGHIPSLVRATTYRRVVLQSDV